MHHDLVFIMYCRRRHRMMAWPYPTWGKFSPPKRGVSKKEAVIRTVAFVGLTLLLLATPALSAADEGELPEGQARASGRYES
jgi:hypothetical protein